MLCIFTHILLADNVMYIYAHLAIADIAVYTYAHFAEQSLSYVFPSFPQTGLYRAGQTHSPHGQVWLQAIATPLTKIFETLIGILNIYLSDYL